MIAILIVISKEENIQEYEILDVTYHHRIRYSARTKSVFQQWKEEQKNIGKNEEKKKKEKISLTNNQKITPLKKYHQY